jgi:hypothetical protein
LPFFRRWDAIIVSGDLHMLRILNLAAALPRRAFAAGTVFGAAFTLLGLAALSHFGAFPTESEGLILSADYRLSRNETSLREEIQYLEHELALSRRASSSTASAAGDDRS